MGTTGEQRFPRRPVKYINSLKMGSVGLGALLLTSNFSNKLTAISCLLHSGIAVERYQFLEIAVEIDFVQNITNPTNRLSLFRTLIRANKQFIFIFIVMFLNLRSITS